MTDRKLRGADARLLKGYAPLVGLLVLYALIVVLTPSVAREQLVTSNGVSPGGRSASTVPGASTSADGTDAGSGSTRSASGRGPGGEGGAGGRVTASGATAPCPDRELQVEGDPYSPPCVVWSGDNGGVTYNGVTADSIRLSYRLTQDPGLQAILGQLADKGIPKETPEDVERTALALIDYFNANFQLYGRKLELIGWQGRGSAINEATGGGQDLANADAIRAAQELNIFGDVSALTPPYAAALKDQGVMAFGAPYMSRKWFNERAPYVWSIVPDCSQLAELNIAAYVKLLAGKNAEYAGDEFKNSPRKLALIAPNTPVYQECVDDGLALLKSLGGGEALRLDYTLDPGSLSAQAGNVLDQLIANDITSVALGTDPLLPLFLTDQAAQRGYYPEWLVLGTALTDADLVGQLYIQDEWKHAFGVSQLGPQTDQRSTLGYQAYKQMRPDSEPSLIVDLLYYQFYEVVIGVQMAGPTLTPDNFAQGMFMYPGGTGLAGTWKFGPGDYTAQDDGVLIWWDPEAISDYDHKKGRYIQASGRFKADSVPDSAPLFVR